MALVPPTTRLQMYVGSLDAAASESDLLAAFASVGVPLAHVELVLSRATGCRLGFAFVALAGWTTCADAEAVLARMRVALVDGRPVTVQWIRGGQSSSPICVVS